MNFPELVERIRGRYQRTVAGAVFRRPLVMRNREPYISFAFDDFPSSALHIAGEILARHGLRGTYYASLGLMGTVAPTGRIFVAEDLKLLQRQGHELGCHTFAHCHSWETSPAVFERSVAENSRAIEALSPGTRFKSFAYPISGPRIWTKHRIGKRFGSCRGGGQTFNAKVTDLNLLKSFFLEKSRDNPDKVKNLIENNRRACGWLILSTHDVEDAPTVYGCKPEFFEKVVIWAKDSGAKILPVAEALESIRAQG